MSTLPSTTPVGHVSRTTRCTEHNAKAFQQIVKQTPQLLALVQDLQAANIFPGLRAMSVTITAPPDLAAKGLDAWHEIYQSSQSQG